VHINGMLVHHCGSQYDILLPNKVQICRVIFPQNDGDTQDEERIVKIMIKHLRQIWRV